MSYGKSVSIKKIIYDLNLEIVDIDEKQFKAISNEIHKELDRIKDEEDLLVSEFEQEDYAVN